MVQPQNPRHSPLASFKQMQAAIGADRERAYSEGRLNIKIEN